jgi:hypothetical protein
MADVYQTCSFCKKQINDLCWAKHLKKHTPFANKRGKFRRRKNKVVKHYPQQWTEALRAAVRDRDGHVCCWCNKAESDNGQKLSVHHLDKNVKNCKLDNLVSLCVDCHDLKAHKGFHRKPHTMSKDEFNEMRLEQVAKRYGI